MTKWSIELLGFITIISDDEPTEKEIRDHLRKNIPKLLSVLDITSVDRQY